jgi:phosphopantothenoylcysteine synthetase/decarboxylase
MSTAKNDITGDLLASRPANNLYRDNYDAIFCKEKKDVKDGAANDITTPKNDSAHGNPASGNS